MNLKLLQDLTKQQLAAMAQKKGILGWHGMRKEELIEALADPQQGKTSSTRQRTPHIHRNGNGKVKMKPKNGARPQVAAARNTSNGNSGEEIVERSKFDVGVPTKDLSAKVPKDLPAGYGKDRIVVMVRDPYWLHAYWEVTRQAVARAEAALGQGWHGAKPILRLLDVTTRDTTNASESIVRDIEIHGGCNNWYIDVANPPRSYRIDIGYLAKQRPVLRPGPLQRGDHAASRHQRRHRRKLGRFRHQEGRPHLRHVWRLRSVDEQPGTEAAVRGTAAAAARFAVDYQFRLRCDAAEQTAKILVPARRRADRLRRHRARTRG